MNILFLTIGGFKNPAQNGVYTDLLRYFLNENHAVYTVCQRERRENLKTVYQKESNIHVLRVKTGNITKARWMEKGISTLLIGYQYNQAIQAYFSNIKFDIVLYSTPPITLSSLVGKLRQTHQAFTYLMLKDIFPQNAVDLGLLRKSGIKGIIYHYFRLKEKQLYDNSDRIGCMSLANKRYLLEHNPELQEKKVEICPNTLDCVKTVIKNKEVLRKKLKLPPDKILFLYGGNFGKPQNVDFIVEALRAGLDFKNFHFVLCGSGTEFNKIIKLSEENLPNITVFEAMPFQKYAELLSACDIGMLFLDYRFTIPNFPSRLLDYLNYNLPVLAATDKNTDVGSTIVDGGFGWWCESKDIKEFLKVLAVIETEVHNLSKMGETARKYLEDHYSTALAYEKIMTAYHLEKGNTDV